MATGPGGSRGIAFGIVAVVLAVLVLMPALALVGFYTFANVSAIAEGTDFSSDAMNVAVFLLGLVATVTVVVLGMSVAIGWIGRGLSPKRRGDEPWLHDEAWREDETWREDEAVPEP